MYRIIFFFIFLSFIHLPASSQEDKPGYMFRLYLKDKANTPYSIDKPDAFLSQKAIERRKKQAYPVDSTDLPVDPQYISAIREKGAEIKAVSKWLNTVSVYFSDSMMVESVRELPFVDSVRWVWTGKLSNWKRPKSAEAIDIEDADTSSSTSYYGFAYDQIHLNNGDLLHATGFKGEGMTIAVLDASFSSVKRMDAFDPFRILGSRNFTHQEYIPFSKDNEHGTKVLSCMLSNKPGKMVGTAPNAFYYLIQTEVYDEEYAIEEDYWAAGIEFADSLGVDIVTSSLGYTEYDAPSMNYTHNDLNGKTAQISKAASMAYRKGLLLFVSAGNERNKDWEKIAFPADAENIVTVGAVDSQKEIAYFSSCGYTADGRVKPDLMAKGLNVSVLYPSGNISMFTNGTSFSTPILAGLGACLWQSLPDLTNLQIIELLKKSADRYHQPDSMYGYGIPNVYQAYLSTMLKNIIKL